MSKSQSSDIPKIPIIGNGDIFSYTDYEENKCDETYLDNLDKNLIFMQFPRIMKEYMMYQYDIVG